MKKVAGVSVVIPTYNRASADQLRGMDYFTGAMYVLPESQRDQYLPVIGHDRMIVIPDDRDGNLCRKRNWILENIPRPLIMLDDDVLRITHTEGGQYFQENGRAKQKIELPANRFEWWLGNCVETVAQTGARFWGVNTNTDGRNYEQFRPFSFVAYIGGPFQGHMDHGLQYDERMPSKDDVDMTLQQLNQFKQVFRFNKFAYDCAHATNAGGLVGMRTMDYEVQGCEAVMRKWGSHIVRYRLPAKKMTDVLNPRFNFPISGV